MIGPGFAAAVGARTIKRIAVALIVVGILGLVVGYVIASRWE